MNKSEIIKLPIQKGILKIPHYPVEIPLTLVCLENSLDEVIALKQHAPFSKQARPPLSRLTFST